MEKLGGVLVEIMNKIAGAGKSYGPGGKWIHDRAHRIMEEGETKGEYGKKKGKSVAYAIATQQAHSLGRSPKSFRTSSGVSEAKQKFDAPKKEYQKTASDRLLTLDQASVLLQKLAVKANEDKPSWQVVSDMFKEDKVFSTGIK